LTETTKLRNKKYYNVPRCIAFVFIPVDMLVYIHPGINVAPVDS